VAKTRSLSLSIFVDIHLAAGIKDLAAQVCPRRRPAGLTRMTTVPRPAAPSSTPSDTLYNDRRSGAAPGFSGDRPVTSSAAPLTPEARNTPTASDQDPAQSDTKLRIAVEPTSSPSPSPLSRPGANAPDAKASSPRPSQSLDRKGSLSSSYRSISRTPSLKAALAHNFAPASGTSSLVSSPIISALGDVTPLPSPLIAGESLDFLRRMPSLSSSPPMVHGKFLSVGQGSVLVTASGESIDAAITHGPKRKLYTSLEPKDGGPLPAAATHKVVEGHGRNRSISEYIPDPKAIPRRQHTVSGSHGDQDNTEPHMRRELN
jgi:protein-serine/threonine kinase